MAADLRSKRSAARAVRATRQPAVRRAAALLGASALWALACNSPTSPIPQPAPVLQQQNFAQGQRPLRRVAVATFRPSLELMRQARPAEQVAASAVGAAGAPVFGADDIAKLVSRFVSDALVAEGIDVVRPSDVAQALGRELAPGAQPPIDPRVAAPQLAQELGVTSLLLGVVHRYREREGQAMGTLKSASVWFEVSLYEAPSGFRLWTSRFDETQRPLSENLLNAGRYPGGGTRWLSAPEMARWGAREIARALAARRQPG